MAPEMSRKYRKFSPEFRDEAVQLVIENSRPIAQVARELGVNDGTLGNWVNQYRNEHADEEPPLNGDRAYPAARSPARVAGTPDGERVPELCRCPGYVDVSVSVLVRAVTGRE
jgi:transposase-like protein